MARKKLLGMALVAGVCMIAAAGYRFGKHLRQSERAQVEREVPAAASRQSDA